MNLCMSSGPQCLKVGATIGCIVAEVVTLVVCELLAEGPWHSFPHMSGRARYGDRGGRNQPYYAGLYAAKGRGREAMLEYIRIHGPPPSKGQGAFHPRGSRDAGSAFVGFRH